jgi:hypothetical protein
MFSKGIIQLDFSSDGNAVLGDGWGAEFFIQQDVPTLGSQGHFDGVGELLDASEEASPGLFVKKKLLWHRTSPCVFMLEWFWGEAPIY